jgi:hypothetical protein
MKVGDARYEYRVRRGDTLSRVAKIWLNGPDRWPDICRLNKHRHFDVGGTLTDCDLIYPGWELRPSRRRRPTGRRETRPTSPATRDASAHDRPAVQPNAGTRPFFCRAGDTVHSGHVLRVSKCHIGRNQQGRFADIAR